MAIFYFFLLLLFLVLLCLHKHSLDTTTSIDSEEIKVDQLKKKLYHTTTSFDILFHHRKHTQFDFLCFLSFWSAILYTFYTWQKKLCTSNTIIANGFRWKTIPLKHYLLLLCAHIHTHKHIEDRKYLARIAQNAKALPIHTAIN